MAENASLRESLVMMQKELVAVLNEKSAELSLVRTPGSEMGLLQCTSFSTHFYLCCVSFNGACYLVVIPLPLPPLPLPALPSSPPPPFSQLSQDPAMDHSPTTTGQPEQDELLSSGHFQMPYNIVRDGEGGGEGEGCVYV